MIDFMAPWWSQSADSVERLVLDSVRGAPSGLTENNICLFALLNDYFAGIEISKHDVQGRVFGGDCLRLVRRPDESGDGVVWML